MQKVLTPLERDELIAHVEREQDLALLSLAAAQAELGRLQNVYRQNWRLLEKLKKAKIFDEHARKHKPRGMAGGRQKKKKETVNGDATESGEGNSLEVDPTRSVE